MQELVLAELQSRSASERSGQSEAAARQQEFELLLPESSRLAFRIARAVLRNDADAEDAAQEALLRAFRRLDRLRDRTRFRSWLVRIVYRIALDRIRARKRVEQGETLWFREAAGAPASGDPSRNEFQSELWQAVDALPEKLRLVLVLSAIEGHTMEEVAALLSIPSGTVKSRLFFARKKVAEKLRCFVKPIENR